MEKKVTIYTIAEELNMTPTSVSRAFNPKTRLDKEKRRLILETAEKYGFKPNRMASRLAMDELKIGILIYAGFMPYCERLIAGFEAAEQRMSDYKIKSDLRVLKRSEYTPEDCCAVLREFADNGYHGIILSGLYEPFLPEIRNVIEQGCQVVTVHYALEDSGCLFSSTHNYALAGQLAADFLNAAGRRSCLLVTGDMQITLHRSVKNSFLRQIDDYGIRLFEAIDGTTVPGDRERFYTEYLTEKKGCIDSVYITNGDSIALCRSIRKVFGAHEITLVTSDIFPELCDYINDGTVSATVFQNQFCQAEQAYEQLARYLMKTIRQPEPIEITPLLVTRSALPFYS